MNRGKSSDETLIEMNRTAWSGGGKCVTRLYTLSHMGIVLKILTNAQLCFIQKLAPLLFVISLIQIVFQELIT